MAVVGSRIRDISGAIKLLGVESLWCGEGDIETNFEINPVHSKKFILSKYDLMTPPLLHG